MSHTIKIIMAIGLLAIIPVAIDRWSTVFNSSLATLHPNLPDIVLFIMIIPIVGIGAYDYGKKRSHEQIDNKKYNPKFLNDNVFRKLMRVEYKTNYKGDLSFEIPNDERALQHRHSGTYYMWLSDKITGRWDNSDHSSIETAIPNLKIGERYLEVNYKDIFTHWLNIKKIISEYNQKRNNFRQYLGDYFKKEFLPKFPMFVEQPDIEIVDSKFRYFTKNIRERLDAALRHKKENGEIPYPFPKLNMYQSEEYWVLQEGNGRVLLVSSDKTKIDVSKIQEILIKITNDVDIQKKFDEAYTVEDDLFDKIKKFNEELEDNVVNDIDAQISIN